MSTHGLRTRLGALLAPALLLAASPALAQDATVYATQAEYDAAAGASDGCLDFNGSPGAAVPGSGFSAAVAFDSPEAAEPSTVNWSSDAISDAGSTLAFNGVGPVGGTFAGTANAFRLTFLSNTLPATVELYAEDASLIATVGPSSAPGFFGVVSAVPVKRFVIRPGRLDPFAPLFDRFFLDDFCFTSAGAAPPPPPPPPPPPATDLQALCDELAAAVAAADPAAFRAGRRQRALGNKLRVVCDAVEAGDAASLCRALQKLERDLLPKVDGEESPRDWTADGAVQQDIEDRVTALAAALADAIEALGGCPDGGDDEDDGDEDDGDDGAGHGHGHGRGHGHGHGHGHGRGHGGH